MTDQKQTSHKYTMEKRGRGYEVLRDGQYAGYFRTKRLAKKFIKGYLNER